MPAGTAALRLLFASALLATSAPLRAQVAPDDDPRRVPVLPQREFRLEAVAADAPSALAALGLNLRAGWYVRVGASVGIGVIAPEAGPQVGLLRGDASVRFHLDPFAERRRGLYGGVGVSAAQVGGGIGGQPPVLVLLAGVESQPRRGRAWALELGLGGGLRVGLAWRSARRDGYR